METPLTDKELQDIHYAYVHLETLHSILSRRNKYITDSYIDKTTIKYREYEKEFKDLLGKMDLDRQP